jgi:hypothetical protein
LPLAIFEVGEVNYVCQLCSLWNGRTCDKIRGRLVLVFGYGLTVLRSLQVTNLLVVVILSDDIVVLVDKLILGVDCCLLARHGV